MSERSRIHGFLTFLGTLAVASPSLALEPLSVYWSFAEQNNFDEREAHLLREQREDEVSRAWWKLAPTLSVTATYTRNQYESIARVPLADGSGVREAVILPNDQRDLYLSASVPLVDVASWERIGAAKRTREAAEARTEATRLSIKERVAATYFNVIGAEALSSAARRSLSAAEKNLSFVQTRSGAGLAQELDVRRASAEVERNHQALADAELQAIKYRKTLATLSGKEVSPGAPTLSVSLEPEAPLVTWQSTNFETLPLVRAADADARAMRREASASLSALIPTITATGQERFTNAVGFGQAPYYALAVSAAFKLDPTTFSSAAAQRSAAGAAQVRADAARQQAFDRIHDAWHDIQAFVQKSKAARAEVEATQLASKVAKQRYESGTATFLDVVTAERDAFRAEVARIQADASLAFARIALRLSANHTVTEKGSP